MAWLIRVFNKNVEHVARSRKCFLPAIYIVSTISHIVTLMFGKNSELVSEGLLASLWFQGKVFFFFIYSKRQNFEAEISILLHSFLLGEK